MTHVQAVRMEGPPRRAMAAMPLMLASQGGRYTVSRVRAGGEEKAHLENLGFVPGAEVFVVAEMAQNSIVEVKGARVALGRQMAQKVYVEEA